jgi:DNA modification methylase
MLYSRKNEIVFEPFLGSGTTLIACEVMKRVCCGVDVSPVYVAATLERWNILTGKTPIKVEVQND